MKRVLKIIATDGTTIARVRIEVECSRETALDRGWSSARELAGRIIHNIAGGVMQSIGAGNYFRVPLSQQRVGR